MARIREIVSAMLYAADGRLLLQQRDDNPAIPYPGHWTLFGGSVEPGEPPCYAVRRELMEELELDLPFVLWKTYVDPNRTIPDDLVCMHYSYMALLDRDPDTLTQHEGQARGLFTGDEIRPLTIAFGQKPLLEEFLARRPYA
jgi:8-oxo-dGTP diphosphatase